MRFRNYCILERREGPLAAVQAADHQHVAAASGTIPHVAPQQGADPKAPRTHGVLLILQDHAVLVSLIHAPDFTREKNNIILLRSVGSVVNRSYSQFRISPTARTHS